MTHNPKPTDAQMKALPCPFCGGTKIRFDEHGRSNDHLHYGELIWSMCCYDCGATFPNMYRKEGLLEKWNTRATEARAQGLVEVLKQIVSAFEADFCIEGSVVDDPDPLLTMNWQLAKIALATWRRT